MVDRSRETRRRRLGEAHDRVHIVYNAGEDGTTTELPLKILVLDDFGATNIKPTIEQRKPVVVERHVLAEVLRKQVLELAFDVDDHLREDAETFPFVLRPQALSDFEPAGLLRTVPQLAEHDRQRARLQAARERWLASGTVRAVFGRRPAAAPGSVDAPPSLVAELLANPTVAPSDQPPAPLDLDEEARLLAEVEAAGLDDREIASAFVRFVLERGVWGEAVLAELEATIATMAGQLARQLDAVLHHPRFARVEAAWRSLFYLVENVNQRENTIVEILHVGKDELLRDFEDSSELAQSGLYRVVYSAEYGTFGGKPFGLICANYSFGPSAPDLALLRHCAAVAAVAHAPFIANADPSFFGETTFARVPVLDLHHLFEGEQYRRWRSLREAEDARYVGLCLPRFLLRRPYTPHTAKLRGVAYREASGPGPERCLWGPCSVIFAVRVAQAFAKYRWCVNIIGDADVGGSMRVHLPEHPAMGEVGVHIPVEVLLSERKEFELAEQGFVPLIGRRAAADACLFSANSVRSVGHHPNTEEGRASALNQRLGTQFPYLFIVTRLAHYIKVIQREPLGSIKDAAELERALNDWIRQYVADMETVSASVRSRKPLRRASIRVEEVAGRGDWFRCHVKVRPHFRYMGAAFTLDIGSKLDKSNA
ncbi:MAG: type VI secretion system contractile sheath large subunit [Myxococcales bacterium FL481]|nr:MAG: type VI secretion system contractile sheath large subunit [Myxococcales bacterium FL481]